MVPLILEVTLSRIEKVSLPFCSLPFLFQSLSFLSCVRCLQYTYAIPVAEDGLIQC